MLTVNDLAHEYFSVALGNPPSLPISDLERAYYASVVANPQGKTLNDLQYAFYVGSIDGSIGGGGMAPGTPVVVNLNTATPSSTATGTATFTPQGASISGHEIVRFDLALTYTAGADATLNFASIPIDPWIDNQVAFFGQNFVAYLYSGAWEMAISSGPGLQSFTGIYLKA